MNKAENTTSYQSNTSDLSKENNKKTRVRQSYNPFQLKCDKNTVSASAKEIQLIDIIEDLKKEYSAKLRQLENKKDLYQGKHLRCCKHRDSYQYYIWEPSKSPKAKFCNVKSPLIQSLAQRDYENDLKKNLNKRIVELDNILQVICKGSPVETYESKSEGLRRYIHPAFVNTNKYTEIWRDESYYKKEINADLQYHVTDNGEQVRSKSEVLIANALFHLGLPYRYECPLEMNGITFHPDFTILNPRTGKIYYWEHLGMMDDRQYLSDALKRIQIYESYGIAVGRDLILTTETSFNQLNTKRIETAINLYIK